MMWGQPSPDGGQLPFRGLPLTEYGLKLVIHRWLWHIRSMTERRLLFITVENRLKSGCC